VLTDGDGCHEETTDGDECHEETGDGDGCHDGTEETDGVLTRLETSTEVTSWPYEVTDGVLHDGAGV
jgi:hypothetical protein